MLIDVIWQYENADGSLTPASSRGFAVLADALAPAVWREHDIKHNGRKP